MIASATNPRIKEARKLQRRRYRHSTGRLLIEGVRLVADAVAAGMRPYLVFYAPELLTGEQGKQLVEELAQSGVETVACSTAVFSNLTETVTPQGIAAVIALPHLPLPAHPDLILILDRVREPGNAGALLRSAEAAGVDVVLFGPETVDPFNDKSIRAGMGAHFRLPLRICQEWSTLLDYVQGKSSGGVEVGSLPRTGRNGAPGLYMADAGGSLHYDEVDWQLPAALVVGGEADGPSPTAKRVATSISIPMLGRTESLNSAIAGAVILFEAARQRRRAKDAR